MLRNSVKYHHTKGEGWLKTFSEKQKLREYVASEPSLYEILKEVLRGRENNRSEIVLNF